MKGVIFDIKRFAIHDGPGIRTTVFLKGCPLRCAWCHNPESQRPGVETLAGRDGPTPVGRKVSAAELVREVARDTVFFDESQGGVTFSGGEPLAQPAFLVEALDRCGDLAIHRAVDTSGHAPRDVLLDVARRTDLFLYDVKLMNDARHQALTGVAATPILENLRALCETGVAIRIRVPVIPGITDTDANLAALGAWLRTLPRALPVTLLPYHAAAMDKYRRFGWPVPLPDTREASADELANVRVCLGPPSTPGTRCGLRPQPSPATLVHSPLRGGSGVEHNVCLAGR